jgi:diguanylate cyclase (GGDEF)-like protein
VRFGKSAVDESLQSFATAGGGGDAVAVYGRDGRLIAELAGNDGKHFPGMLDEFTRRRPARLQPAPVIHPLSDDDGAGAFLLGSLVVVPNEAALHQAEARAVIVLLIVIGLAGLLGAIAAHYMSRALVRPLAKLTDWADSIDEAAPSLAVRAPRANVLEVDRLSNAFEALIAKIAEQNRELKRRQYELKSSNVRLESLAYSDPLTGLPNRSMFQSTLAAEIELARTQRRSFAVLFIDMNRLKLINDTWGHASGDTALRAAAMRIRHGLRSNDFLARFAGDEFVVISNGIGCVEDAKRLSDRLMTSLATPLPEDHWREPLCAGIGVGLYPDDGDDINTLVHHADMAMYRVKAEQSIQNATMAGASSAGRAQPQDLGQDEHD